MLVPQPDESLVQHGQQSEPPLNGVYEDLFTAFGELVEHEEEEEEVDLFSSSKKVWRRKREKREVMEREKKREGE